MISSFIPSSSLFSTVISLFHLSLFIISFFSTTSHFKISFSSIFLVSSFSKFSILSSSVNIGSKTSSSFIISFSSISKFKFSSISIFCFLSSPFIGWNNSSLSKTSSPQPNTQEDHTCPAIVVAFFCSFNESFTTGSAINRLTY